MTNHISQKEEWEEFKSIWSETKRETLQQTPRILETFFENAYLTKLEHLKEMDKFLGIHDLLKLNQDEINNLKRPLTPSEIDARVKNFPTKNTS